MQTERAPRGGPFHIPLALCLLRRQRTAHSASNGHPSKPKPQGRRYPPLVSHPEFGAHLSERHGQPNRGTRCASPEIGASRELLPAPMSHCRHLAPVSTVVSVIAVSWLKIIATRVSARQPAIYAKARG